MRLDQWLWAVRLYRTRTVAAAAVRSGHVTIAGETLKPARGVKPGEIVAALTGDITRTYRVVGHPPSRVAARLVPTFAEDLTPPEACARPSKAGTTDGPPVRPRGSGRPTKRDRRAVERWHDRDR